MGSFKSLFKVAMICTSFMFAEHEIDRIAFLIANKDYKKAISYYLEEFKQKQSHHLDILTILGKSLIEEAINSEDPKEQLLGLYGLMVSAQSNLDFDFSKLIQSKDLNVQMLAIQYLSNWHDDEIELLLNKAMSSPFLPARIMALGALVQNKSKLALMHIESLYYRLPPPFRPYFAQYYAMLGTPASLKILKQMLSDAQVGMKHAALLSICQFERDDFIEDIRKILTQNDPLITECAIKAVGLFHDLKSKAVVENFSKSSFASLKLASLLSLKSLKEDTTKEIIEMANQGDLFAIAVLSRIDKSEDTLVKLAGHPDINIKLNALFALLERRDPRAKKLFIDFLKFHSLHDGINSIFSAGKTQSALKIYPAFRKQFEKSKEMVQHIEGMTRIIRNQLLIQALELPEDDFLEIAKFLFDHDIDDLIPLAVKLLENCNSEKTQLMLEKMEQKTGSPKTRLYSLLALARQKSNRHQIELIHWLSSQTKQPIIELEAFDTQEQTIKKTDRFIINPDERSELLLEAYETLISTKNEHSFPVLLEAIRKAPKENRAVLAGFLLKAVL
jgi:HEAT repeat protein